VPRFEPKELSLGESLRTAGGDLTILIIINLLLFASLFVLFLRSDVRQR